MEKRALRGDDVIHMTLASPTGTMSPVDAPVTLDEIMEFVLTKIPAPPPMDEIVAAVAAKMAPAPAAPVAEPVVTERPVA